MMSLEMPTVEQLQLLERLLDKCSISVIVFGFSILVGILIWQQTPKIIDSFCKAMTKVADSFQKLVRVVESMEETLPGNTEALRAVREALEALNRQTEKKFQEVSVELGDIKKKLLV